MTRTKSAPEPYGYVPDVPLYVHTPCLPPIAGVDDLLAHWAGVGIVPILVGAGVTLGSSLDGGPGVRRPEDADAFLVERWAPLIAARLGGERVPCSVADCLHDGSVMLVGRVAVCTGHAAAPVGTEIEQPQTTTA